MTRTGKAALEQRAFELMVIIESEANPQTRTAYLAYRGFAEKLGVSESCVRFTLNNLLETGWIAKCERFLPNGGQLENAYILTPLGRAQLKTHQAQAPKKENTATPLSIA